MKFALAFLAAVSAASVHHHNHLRHKHVHPRAVDGVENIVTVPYIAYELNGELISADEAEKGLADGTLRLYSDGASNPPAAAHYHHHSQVETSPTSATSVSSTTITLASYGDWSTSDNSWPDAPRQTHASSGDDSNYSSDWSSGVDTPFPNGQVDCSTFPSAYGAIPVDWVGLGGWTGIQQPQTVAGGFSNIMTIVSSLCQGGDCCTEGSYCSYACPAGYQKAQWPQKQGAEGQSVGGLLCQNGKLSLTNPALSDRLCIPGASEVTVLIENQLSQSVSVCRTDYPGTEGETIPLNAVAGATTNLTCPNAAHYYTWQGAYTSAQYYVNPAGVPVHDACQWGSPGNPWGNYAPLNLGVGYSDGAAWLSVFQNLPTTNAKLDFAIEIVGDGVSGTCRYANGQYCGGANYDQCSSTTGCTVSLTSGTATFVFSDA